ncbi:MAG: rhomboid family intramembrane serine protease [Akkermansiaceae bacterium]|nr:rhomboid family intramembrane serine protease [Akkermansiaceae bacterium]
MGLADRHYQRVPPHQAYGGVPRPPSRLSGCPVVKWLLISNIAIYLIEMLINSAPVPLPGFPRDHDSLIWNWGYFSVDAAIYSGQVWRFLTFQFLHGDGMHVLFNMIALFFFGPYVERWWGSRKFIVFYLASGVAGALLYTLLLVAPGMIPSDESWRQMIGASAGIYAILVAVAIIAPNLKVLLYFFIPMSIRTMAMIALGIAAYMALTNGHNAGGEAAHLGGAILGFILMKKPGWLSFVKDGPLRAKKRPTIDATIVREKKIRPRIEINLADSEVDRILDKVTNEGLQSLTEAEKDVLRRLAGK